jgi:ABC-2 type transport system ATP-binding protein
MLKTDHHDIPALATDNVRKTYSQWQRTGGFRDIFLNLLKPQKIIVNALDGISISLRRGEFVAYAGANGAGKSTTIKILSGILRPTSGNVTVLGMNPATQRVSLMKRIGVLFGQRTELWWDHPVINSYEWKKHVWGIPHERYGKTLGELVELLDLSPFLYTFARELSLGQRMRADLAMLLLHEPELIFLDEPTLGLDVLGKRRIISFLKKLNSERNTTIIVTSHDMDDLEEMAERIILLSKGKVIYDGDFDTLRMASGGCSRISVTSSAPEPPKFSGMSLIETDDNIHTYVPDKTPLELRQIFAELASRDDIKDIEIKKTPIEDVIANLYMAENNCGKATR